MINIFLRKFMKSRGVNVWGNLRRVLRPILFCRVPRSHQLCGDLHQMGKERGLRIVAWLGIDLLNLNLIHSLKARLIQRLVKMMARRGKRKICKKNITQIYLITLVLSLIVLPRSNNSGGLKEVNFALEIWRQLVIRPVGAVKVTWVLWWLLNSKFWNKELICKKITKF